MVPEAFVHINHGVTQANGKFRAPLLAPALAS